MMYFRKDMVISAGAIVFNKHTNEVLVIINKGTKDNEIYFPKGRMESGESLHETACREVKEETGVVCKIRPEIIGIQIRYSEPIKKTKIIYWYAADFECQGDQALEEDENFERMWVSIEEASNILTFSDDKALFSQALHD